MKIIRIRFRIRMYLLKLSNAFYDVLVRVLFRISKKDQKKLYDLIEEYIEGHTATVYNEWAFMKKAVESYKAMENPLDQDEFDALMET